MLHLTNYTQKSFRKGDILLNESASPKSLKREKPYYWNLKSDEESIDLEKLYELTLSILFEYFEKKNILNLSKNGFRTLIGNWLFTVHLSIYDRILSIKKSNYFIRGYTSNSTFIRCKQFIHSRS